MHLTIFQAFINKIEHSLPLIPVLCTYFALFAAWFTMLSNSEHRRDIEFHSRSNNLHSFESRRRKKHCTL